MPWMSINTASPQVVDRCKCDTPEPEHFGWKYCLKNITCKVGYRVVFDISKSNGLSQHEAFNNHSSIDYNLADLFPGKCTLLFKAL